MEVGADELIRSMRARAGLSQQELASRAHMAQSAVSNYENGRKAPSLATLDRLARAAGVELDISYTPAAKSRRVTLASLRKRRAEIEAACARHGASRPRVFGSVARGESRADSDIDLLIDIAPGRTLFDVAALHDELVELLGQEVDLLTAGAVRGRLAHIAGEAVPL
jgi:predicted nucleotidyltransferase